MKTTRILLFAAGAIGAYSGHRERRDRFIVNA
jgi:hypothetical protein